jgi:hypothetical protein
MEGERWNSRIQQTNCVDWYEKSFSSLNITNNWMMATAENILTLQIMYSQWKNKLSYLNILDMTHKIFIYVI